MTAELTPMEKITQLANDLGLSITCSTPLPRVRDGWPCIAYQVRLMRRGQEVWSGPYHLGIGHVKTSKDTPYSMIYQMTSLEETVLMAIQSRKQLKDAPAVKQAQASLACKLAVLQKVQPKLADVLHSLSMDGSPFFHGQTFEEWCSDFGYDTDSRKAFETFQECDATGRKLSRAFTAEELDQLQAALQDY